FWYLNKKENQQLWMNRNSNFLSPEDFFVHIVAHSFVHHSEKNEIWNSDINLLCSKWHGKINWLEVENKLKKYGIKTEHSFIDIKIPLKGHLARFFLLPLRKKITYIINTFFPEDEFIKNRYDIKNYSSLVLWKIFRPFVIVFKSCKAILMFCIDKLRFLY
ncbi:MAG: hypothetical protein ACK4JE_04865, partial [Endomicrobiia bacterium]